MTVNTGEAVEEEDLHSLLVGMEAGVANVEISVEVPPRLENKCHMIQLHIHLLDTYPKPIGPTMEALSHSRSMSPDSQQLGNGISLDAH